tara:strand:- start:1002 stop:1511 length:510 start_codon:yes stop_codon:yes gene_type:complete
MEQKINNKIALKDKLISFYQTNKYKLFVFTIILIIAFISIFILKINSEKKNSLVAEKYIRAGLYLAENKRDQSKNLYEEIILSKNKFYSALALNKILEKDLISDKNKILNYFLIIEKINKSEERDDLLIFKKALYLIKIGNIKEGNSLLKNLIDKESALKILAKEIISE